MSHTLATKLGAHHHSKRFARGRRQTRARRLFHERWRIGGCSPASFLTIRFTTSGTWTTTDRQRHWDADIDAPEAWQITTGSMSTVVAIMDNRCAIHA